MADIEDKIESIHERLVRLFKAERPTMAAFRNLTEAAMRPGKIAPSLKEMVATAIAVAKGCDDCIVYHTAAARKLGASREEFCEVLAVAVEMAGGPGAVYAAKALEAFDELAG